MAKSFHYRIRKTHRYLGLILGIQFLFWTVGGIYFSWSNMDEIHGDLNRRPASLITTNSSFISPSAVIEKMKSVGLKVDSIHDLKLIQLSGKPFYQLLIKEKLDLTHSDHSKKPEFKVQLADAITGELRGPLSEYEAVSIAKEGFIGSTIIREVKLLTETSSHHEYRSGPLPAYAISFDHPSKSTVFVATELGTIQKIRNDKWRIFDFLWMLHTMDYQGRDNFGNILLRGFSIFGLFTIFSGFILFYVSSGKRKSKTRQTIKV
jgi:hypothetical protein